jgi:hypothetical protein
MKKTKSDTRMTRTARILTDIFEEKHQKWAKTSQLNALECHTCPHTDGFLSIG